MTIKNGDVYILGVTPPTPAEIRQAYLEHVKACDRCFPVDNLDLCETGHELREAWRKTEPDHPALRWARESRKRPR